MIQLEQKYDREQFLGFLKEAFLKDFAKDVRPVGVDNFKAIKKAYTLGASSDLYLQVFEFEYSGSFNKRIALAKEAFQVMKQSATFQALAIFYSPEEDDWRFSLMTANPQRTEKGNITVAYSNPRRYSFFLGPNAKTNTPTKFLIKKGMVVDFEDLKSRFSLEVVNKEFYKEIAECYTKLVGGTRGEGRNKKTYESILKLPSVNDHSQTSIEFAVRLIGRIIFCWFLREKISASGSPLMPKELLSLDAIGDNSDYYHKILEPIFFEVLNKPIKSRKDAYQNELFSKIPYLNGGLFSPHDDDFFSYNEGKQAQYHNTVIVPDEWLNELFQILETYNFTIDENTSIDEELSIDPEMLGRIFENLLAEINPETGESARKSTGSYYTPRTIVDYMVDESLLLYLKQKTNIDEKKLRVIISYDLSDDALYPLDENEKREIVDAIEKVKILDPACGSGAFPIGALQKIVFILQQIDSEGKIWFEKQLAKASPEFRRDIESKFSNNELDFIRKIGIIRENIYGIDIQPIATEIARLRCFLTLVVDEQIDDTIENRGIKPLPNLDFKFVTANSLIGLPSSNKANQIGLFEDTEGIAELREIRDMFFTASGTEREQLKLQFVQIQNKMFQRLISENRRGHAELTQMLTTWDPFSHKASEWFDVEWMFGIKKGFDIVIANPPYLKERDNKNVFEKVNISDFGKRYHQGKMDFWFYFLHKAIDLVDEKGIISYITSRYWLNSKGAKKLIKRVSQELSFSSFIDIGKLKVFDSVAGHHMVAVYEKSKNINTFTYKKLNEDLSGINSKYSGDNVTIRELKNSYVFKDNNEIILEESTFDLEETLHLNEVAFTSIGIQESPDKVSTKQINSIKENSGINAGDGVFVLSEPELEALNLSNIEKSVIKSYLDPNDLYKYGIRWNKKYLIYSDKTVKNLIATDDDYSNLKSHLDKFKRFITSSNKPYGLHRPRDVKFFENPKIIFKGMFVKNEFAYDEKGYFVGFSFSLIIQKDPRYSLKYILAILNSKFALDWFYKNGKKRGAGLDIGVEKLRMFPIKKPNELDQNKITNVVDDILNITNEDDYLTNTEKQKKIKELENQINKMIYKLYDLSSEQIKNLESNYD